MSKIDNFKDGIFKSDFPEMMKKEFSRDVYQGLSKEEKEEKFSQWFIDNLVHMFTDAFVKEIQFGDVNEKWLEKYKTKELLDILEKRIDDDSFGSDKGQMESILNTISLLFKREREFQFVKGKEAKTPEEIDALLFPSKKIKGVRGSLPWDIDKWDELNIVIYESNFREIRFQKIFRGKPSVDSTVKMPVSELNLGNKTNEILSHFGHKQNIKIENRDAIYRINKALKELFKMDDNPIVSEGGLYTTKFQVYKVDIYGQMVINKHIHTYSSDSIDVEQIRADDTNVDPSMEDEENYI